jgi:hypothetical protein
MRDREDPVAVVILVGVAAFLTATSIANVLFWLWLFRP